MAKKKKWIYGLTFCTFFILLFLYSIGMIASSKAATKERVENAIEASANSTRRTLEYEIKDLKLVANGEISTTSSLESATLLQGNDYLISEDGILHKQGGSLDQVILDTQLLRAADSTGYSISGFVGSTNQHYWLAIMPLNAPWNGYIARCYSVEKFLNLVSQHIAFSTETLFLFNNFGNLEGSFQLPDSTPLDSVRLAVVNGAGAYSYNSKNHPYEIMAEDTYYNVYFEISDPQGWFVGAQVDSTLYEGNSLENASMSVVFIFTAFVLILVVVIGLDIINEKELKHTLRNANSTDLLTGLVNSIGMQDAVDRFFEKRSDEKYSMVCIDVIAFSRINSMFGFSVGDQLLKIIAEVLDANCFVGIRISADGFCCLTKGLDGSCEVLDRELKEGVARKMGKEYLQVVNFKFGSYPITHYRTENFREIYEGSLLALKNAKKHPSFTYVIYDDQLKKSGEMLRSIELNMMHALSKDEFVMYVQPQMDLPEETCVRGEALIRWDSECMGFIAPDKFVPVFEANGFIVETDFFMLSAAMQFLEKRLAQGKPLITIAVNQSKVTITFPNYYQRLQQLMEEHPTIPLEYIELEVTESALENDWGTIVPLIHQVKKLGFSIAMDDFGSGFSSLNTLRILPIDILKIDRDFLQESDQSERSRMIIQHVILMAKALNIKVVCEGVETLSQLEFLKNCGCDIVQGFYFSRPVPLEDFENQFCK